MMSFKRLFSLIAATVLLLLSACGDNGVQLGEFPALTKTEGDPPFDLVAPSSDSPGTFSFSSSDPSVASIVGKTVTIHKAGTVTITAQQPRTGSYNPTSTSTTLTVAARVCEAPSVNVNGVCVAPSTTAGYVTHGDLVWMPASFVLDWAKADAFCKNTAIDGKKNWKLPTRAQLAALVASGELDGKGWVGGDTWTADAGAGTNTHVVINTSTRAATDFAADKKAYVTCTLSPAAA